MNSVRTILEDFMSVYLSYEDYYQVGLVSKDGMRRGLDKLYTATEEKLIAAGLSRFWAKTKMAEAIGKKDMYKNLYLLNEDIREGSYL